MRTVAIANQKGGSGKTTTVVNLAAAIAEFGMRVLVIDLDPQGSATNWLGRPLGDQSVRDAYVTRAGLEEITTATSAPGVDMIPSSPWIAASDRDEDIAISSGVISMLEHLPPSWDYVLVDCPPSHGALSVAPLAACPAVIIPVETRVLALTGLVSTLETIEAVRERLNPQLTVDAIIASRVNRTRHAQEIVERLRERYSELVLDVEIRETTDLATAPSFQLPVTRYAPDGAGAADFRALAREILDRDRLADLQDDPSIADFTLGSRGPGLRALSTAS